VYFGEMEDGSTISAKGRGIQILNNKEVHLGYWEKNKMNQMGRDFYIKGD
jgi:hypothetical protein